MALFALLCVLVLLILELLLLFQKLGGQLLCLCSLSGLGCLVHLDHLSLGLLLFQSLWWRTDLRYVKIWINSHDNIFSIQALLLLNNPIDLGVKILSKNALLIDMLDCREEHEILAIFLLAEGYG
jgi:hypothetical protein